MCCSGPGLCLSRNLYPAPPQVKNAYSGGDCGAWRSYPGPQQEDPPSAGEPSRPDGPA